MYNFCGEGVQFRRSNCSIPAVKVFFLAGIFNRLAKIAERAAAAAEEKAKSFEEAVGHAEQYRQQRDETIRQRDELQKELEDKTNEFTFKLCHQEETIENLKKEHSREQDNLNQSLKLKCQEQILQMRQEIWESYQVNLNERDNKISELYTKISDIQDALSQTREEKLLLEEKLRAEAKTKAAGNQEV